MRLVGGRRQVIAFVLSAVVLVFGILWIFWPVWFHKSNEYSRIADDIDTGAATSELSKEIKKFGVRIDSIGVLAPVVQDVDGTDKSIYMKELQNGIAHYKGTSLPGEGGNIFLFGHSSAVIGVGKYSTVFAKLGELKEGDEVVIYFQDKPLRYSVFDSEVVSKTDVSVLDETKDEQLTLMTCWPVGSNSKRLVVRAKPVGV